MQRGFFCHLLLSTNWLTTVRHNVRTDVRTYVRCFVPRTNGKTDQTESGTEGRPRPKKRSREFSAGRQIVPAMIRFNNSGEHLKRLVMSQNDSFVKDQTFLCNTLLSALRNCESVSINVPGCARSESNISSGGSSPGPRRSYTRAFSSSLQIHGRHPSAAFQPPMLRRNSSQRSAETLDQLDGHIFIGRN